ncbi:MAG: sugar ABC transporter substrate-binding protein [Chlorobi bacterium]|nr:sugar ABC transporter substrate-binding protein [Chlorobiota bacterium]
MNKYLFLISLIIFGCSSNENKKTEISFWAMGAEGERVNDLIADFEKENPNVSVTVQQVPWSAAQEKLVTAFASDMLPDLFQIGNTWIPQFAFLNAVQKLDAYIDSSRVVNKENYFEGIWNTNVIDSSVFGVPWYVDTRVLFYRSDVLSKAGYNSPPKTWDELFAAAKKIKSILNDEKKYPIYLPTTDWTPYVIFALQNGAELLKENNCYGNFSSQKFKEALLYLTEYHKEKLSPVGVSQVANVYQAFKDKYISMYISGPWDVAEFKKRMGDSLSGVWNVAPLPSRKGNYPGVSLAGGSSLVINKNSENKKAAWKLIEFLSRKKSQLKFFKLLNDLPAVKEVWNDPALINDKYTQAFYEQFKNVIATPKIPEWERIVYSELRQYVEYVVMERMTADDAMKALDKAVDDILAKRRQILDEK